MTNELFDLTGQVALVTGASRAWGSTLRERWLRQAQTLSLRAASARMWSLSQPRWRRKDEELSLWSWMCATRGASSAWRLLLKRLADRYMSW